MLKSYSIFFLKCVLTTQVGTGMNLKQFYSSPGERNPFKGYHKDSKGAQHSSSGFGMIFRVLSLKNNINGLQLCNYFKMRVKCVAIIYTFLCFFVFFIEGFLSLSEHYP